MPGKHAAPQSRLLRPRASPAATDEKGGADTASGGEGLGHVGAATSQV